MLNFGIFYAIFAQKQSKNKKIHTFLIENCGAFAPKALANAPPGVFSAFFTKNRAKLCEFYPLTFAPPTVWAGGAL